MKARLSYEDQNHEFVFGNDVEFLYSLENFKKRLPKDVNTEDIKVKILEASPLYNELVEALNLGACDTDLIVSFCDMVNELSDYEIVEVIIGLRITPDDSSFNFDDIDRNKPYAKE